MTDLATVRVTADTTGVTQATRNLDQLSASAVGAAGTFKGLAPSWLDVARALGEVAIEAIQAAAEVENLQASFALLVDDTDRAAVAFDQLVDLAAATPLALDQIAASAGSLLNAGSSAGRLAEQIRTLGDLSRGSAANFDLLVQAVSAAQATGSVSMEQLNTVTEAGVPIVQALAETLGVSEERVVALAQSGQLGVAELQQAFVDLTSAGGQFHNRLGEIQQTFTGSLATAMESLKLLGAELFEPLLDGGRRVLNWSAEFVDTLRRDVVELREIRDAADEAARAVEQFLSSGTAEAIGSDALVALEREVEALREEARVRGQYLDSLEAAAAQYGPQGGRYGSQDALTTARDEYQQTVNQLRNVETAYLSIAEATRIAKNEELERQRILGDVAKVAALQDSIDQRTLANEQRIQAAFAMTAEGRIAGLREQIEWFGAIQDNAGRTAAIVAHLKSQLDDLTATPFKAQQQQEVEFQPRTLQQELADAENQILRRQNVESLLGKARERRSGLSPDDPQIEQFDLTIERLEQQRAVLGDVERTWGDVWDNIRGVGDEVYSIQDFVEEFGQQMIQLGQDLVASSVVESMTALGESIALGENGWENMGDALSQIGYQYLKLLPQMLTMAGLQLLIVNPALWPLALALILAGGAIALGVGYIEGTAQREADEIEAQSSQPTGSIDTSSYVSTQSKALMGSGNPDSVYVAAGSTGGEAAPVLLTVNNYAGAEVQTEESVDAEGMRRIEVMVTRTVQRSISDGTVDGAMQSRYGINRRGVR